MSWTQRVTLAILAGLAGLVIMGRLNGSGRPAGTPSPIKGAVHASAVPVYPGARLTDIMGGNYYAEIGGAATFTSQSWFFSTGDPVAKVADFYRRNLPEGARQVQADEGEVAFEWIPPGAARGEKVSITLREGQIQIGETVKAKG